MSAVFQAAFAGDVAALRAALVETSAPLEARDDTTGGTPLYAAAFHGHTACVALLLEAGCDARSEERRPPLPAPLWVAAANGHRGVVEQLLAAGADVHLGHSADGGSQPLRAAVRGRHAGCVQRLLAAGADVDASDSRGVTALMEAVYAGDALLARQLCAAGANADRKASNGLTAREMASERVREAMIDVEALRRQASAAVRAAADGEAEAAGASEEVPSAAPLVVALPETARDVSAAAPLVVALPETARDVSAAATKGECVVCLERPRACAFVPCMHYCVCAECGDDIMRVAKACPICRKRATDCATIYES